MDSDSQPSRQQEGFGNRIEPPLPPRCLAAILGGRCRSAQGIGHNLVRHRPETEVHLKEAYV